MLSEISRPEIQYHAISPQASDIAWPTAIPEQASASLTRMFRDPRVLEKSERQDLIDHLRTAVQRMPAVPEVRVLLGMALCVNLEAQEALEQLRTASLQAPDCFIARLKYAELLMRLRICDKAQEETHRAAQLASNAAQSELARRQAATIRSMMREGIERGGYQGLLSRLFPKKNARSRQHVIPALPKVD